ncbi:uncharacterized protein CCOS01_01415 [Colletotrichum costaricense]|uniref:Uncharacterized protein n=1 Tax=Colletotrichum costaricense TaxID=1209916 RepID=A0AAI9ZCL8_9PEZI|nr:uncharacterized protein CCOS01_01415 [Colletotrichum costaricense]KAK1540101.1 hypothetical protein CCOS01_01415 [Colletotrichum costaricense]
MQTLSFRSATGHSGRDSTCGSMGPLCDNLSTHCQTGEPKTQNGFQSWKVLDPKKSNRRQMTSRSKSSIRATNLT